MATVEALQGAAREGETRQRILDAALALFAAHGFAGTSMRMLARAAGLRESSIYNHFDGKDELYQAVIGQWGPAEFVERLQSDEYKALADAPEAFLRLCGKHLIERWMDPREHLLAAMITKEGPTAPGYRQFHKALFHDEVELLAGYFRRFSKNHAMIAPDAKQTARMFTAGLMQIRLERFSTLAEMPPRKEVERAVKLYIDNFIAIVLNRAAM